MEETNNDDQDSSLKQLLTWLKIESTVSTYMFCQLGSNGNYFYIKLTFDWKVFDLSVTILQDIPLATPKTPLGFTNNPFVSDRPANAADEQGQKRMSSIV